MDKRQYLIRQSGAYFAISLSSSLGLFILIAMALRDVSMAIDAPLVQPLAVFIVIGLLLSLEDYLVSLFAPATRNSGGSKIRELLLLGVVLYGLILAVQIIRVGEITAAPDGSSVFTLVWSAFYWFSHSSVFYRFMSRLDIARLLEARRGEQLTRLLQDEHLFVLGSYRKMQASIRAAGFRLFFSAVVLLLYATESYPLPAGLQITAAVSLLSQLGLGYMARMYGEDHRYLAWGALPGSAQRRNRSTLIAAFLVISGILALPFFGNRSIVDPQPILAWFGNMLTRVNAPEAARRITQLPFLANQSPSAATWEEYVSRDPGAAARWFFSFTDNLIRVGLIALAIYLIAAPLIRDPRILRSLLRAMRSRGIASGLKELGEMLLYWARGLVVNLRQMIRFPFALIRSLFLALFTQKSPKKTGQSREEQERIVNEIVRQSRPRENRGEGKEREIHTLQEIFSASALLGGRYGLVIKRNNTIREISRAASEILAEVYKNSDSEKLALSTENETSIAGNICFIGLLFEESLYSDHEIPASRIDDARRRVVALEDLFSGVSAGE